MEPSPGNTAESHIPVFPHAVRAQSNTPTCVLPLVGLGLTVGNEWLGWASHSSLALQILHPSS